MEEDAAAAKPKEEMPPPAAPFKAPLPKKGPSLELLMDIDTKPADSEEPKEEPMSDKSEEEPGAPMTDEGEEVLVRKDKGKEKVSEPTNEEPPAFTPAYRVPPWDALPIYDYTLEVLKGGVIIENLDISKKGHYLFGRLPQCDVVTDHPSASRQHAVLQHKENGTVCIYDLGSTHGTFIGKIRLKPMKYCILRLDDMVRFGASTRMYILRGPPEAKEREEQRLIEREMSKEQREQQERENESCSWGFKDDAPPEEDVSEEEEEEEDPQYELAAKKKKKKKEETLFAGSSGDARNFMKKLRAEKAANKGKKKWKNKKQRLAEQEEDEEGEAEGPQKGKMKDLDKVEEEDEAGGEDTGPRKVDFDADWQNDFDEGDDFYDRTKKTTAQKGVKPGAPPPPQVETLESLRAKKAVLIAQKELLQTEMSDLQGPTEGSSDADSLENFMAGLVESMGMEKKKKKGDLLASIDSEMKRVDRLIELSQPAIERLKASSSSSSASASGSIPARAAHAGIAADVERLKKEYLRKAREAAHQAALEAGIIAGEDIGATSSTTAAKPQAKKPAVALPKGPQLQEQKQHAETPDEATAEGVATTTSTKAATKKRKRKQKKQKPVYDDEIVTEEGYGYDEWVPPENQRGDGKTTLNERLGY